MNCFERVKATLKGQRPDQVPVMLHNFMLAAREAGLTMKQYYSNAGNAAMAHIRAVEKYKLDGIVWDIDTAVLASAIGVPVDFPEDEPARAHGCLLESLEEVDELENPEVAKNERIQIAVEGFSILKAHFGDSIFLRANADQAPFSLASMIRTPTLWMTDMVTQPERCHQLLRYCTTACKQFIQLLADEGPHMISNGDSPAGPDMISPEMYREFALPYEREIIEYVHERNLPYMLHICGNTDLILEDMISSGLDAIELDYLTSIQKIHEICSDRVVFSGNINPTGIIARGSPAMVKKKVLELLELYKDSPRLILNAGCAIPPDAPEGNIRAMIDAARNYKPVG